MHLPSNHQLSALFPGLLLIPRLGRFRANGSHIPIGGAAAPPGARNTGRFSANGSGTCGLSWGITSSRSRYAPRSLRHPPPEAAHSPAPAQGYGPAAPGQSWKQGRFSGHDFARQPDGTLRCPAGALLSPTEQRREADGSLRVVYEARIRDCRPCRLREHCQWPGQATKHPRRVSLLLHPLAVASSALLWRDWSRRKERRACIDLLRGQRVEVQVTPAHALSPAASPPPLSRQERAHWRLSWEVRLARNARAPTAGQVTIHLFGVPDAFACFLDLATA